MLQQLILQLNRGESLQAPEAESAVAALAEESIPAEVKADFLCALARKGETPLEIATFARWLIARATPVPLAESVRQREILDVCGTGGDRLNTFNISTTVSILVAAGGVLVAKHGNRAITSQWGSADVLEELGIPVTLGPKAAAEALSQHGFAFFFAPQYHPAFKHIAPARKLCNQRGERTIFNFLGPVLNPVRPSAQLVGVSRPELCPAVADVLRILGVRRAMVVCGETPAGALDELSTLGATSVSETYQDCGIAHSTLNAADFGLPTATLADLQGGDRRANAQTIRDILSGKERGPKRDAVLLNAGAAFFVAGATRSIEDGISKALEVIASGQGEAKLQELSRRST